MDTGNNGQMLNMNIESIGEVKVLTQGYQAEYGRSSGLQITAVHQGRHQLVPRVGLRHLHQLGLELKRRGCSRRTATRSPYAEPAISTATPLAARSESRAGSNKLFFFYAHEYRPQSLQVNGGNVIRLRLPTALERAGDFSQTRDNNGNLLIRR